VIAVGAHGLLAPARPARPGGSAGDLAGFACAGRWRAFRETRSSCPWRPALRVCVFWIGEGWGILMAGRDLALLGLLGAVALLALLAVAIIQGSLRRIGHPSRKQGARTGSDEDVEFSSSYGITGCSSVPDNAFSERRSWPAGLPSWRPLGRAPRWKRGRAPSDARGLQWPYIPPHSASATGRYDPSPVTTHSRNRRNLHTTA